MRKMFFLSFMLILSGRLLYPQTTITTELELLPQGYSIASLSGYGTSGLVNSAVNQGFVNPSALGNFERITAGLSYQYGSSIDDMWGQRITIKNNNSFMPKSASLILPYRALRIGLSAGQLYNQLLDFGEIRETSMENPDGTGRTYRFITRNAIYTYSLTAAYVLKDLFSSDAFSLGVRYNRNYLHRTDEFGQKAKTSGNSDNISAGADYTWYLSGQKYLRAGVSYDSEIRIDGKVKFDEDPAYVQHEINDDLIGNNDQITVPVSDLVLIARVPAKLSLDVDLSIIKDVKLLGTFRRIYWDHVTNAENQTEFAGNILYGFSPSLSASAGYYSSDYRLKGGNLVNRHNDRFKAGFLTCGVVFSYSRYTFDLAVADGHLFSGDYRKQTIGKLAVGIIL